MARLGADLKRMTRTSEYRLVYDEGKKLVGRYYVMFYRRCPDGVKVGITVSGKVGGAVVRNRAKRRTREALRLMLPERISGTVKEAGVELVFVALARIKDAGFGELTEDIGRLVLRISL